MPPRLPPRAGTRGEIRRAVARTVIRVVIVIVGLTAAGPTAAQHPPVARVPSIAGADLTTPRARWELPGRLREASGLAMTETGSVLVHGDERGILVEIDVRRGTVLRELTIGDPVIRGDFEGIVRQGRTVTLMTSDGWLVSGVLPTTGTRLDSVRRIQTGLRSRCELEGLAVGIDSELLLPCKSPRKRRLSGRVTVFAWSQTRSAVEARPSLTIPFEQLGRPMHPSEIAVTTRGTYVLLFGREHAIGEFLADGTALALWSLDRRRHPQPEGLALTPEGLLLIADESPTRRGHATLTVYGPIR